MSIDNYFPFFNKLNKKQQDYLISNCKQVHYKKDDIVHNNTKECTGLLIVKKGQLRAYIISEEGKEITLYRLLDNDICLLSASCMINSLQFDINVEAETDTDLYIIPSEIYHNLMKESIDVTNYTNELMASRFSDVIWLMENIIWKNMDSRLAEFLIEEAKLLNTNDIKITHEKIANHLGTAREVVTRLLKYFQQEAYLNLSRGMISIIDYDGLAKLI